MGNACHALDCSRPYELLTATTKASRLVKLPNLENALISPKKITDYLLSVSHRDGRGKAIFFTRRGFNVDRWKVLRDALLRHAAEHEISRIEKSSFGTRYIIEGKLATPDGSTPAIVSVWFVEENEQFPRFVTAYPQERRRR